MERAKHEVEVKLPFASANEARIKLETLGFRLVSERLFEDNVVLDRAHDTLRDAGKLLRIRRYGERAWLTLKTPVAGEQRHKVRAELETLVADAGMMLEIFGELGFSPAYRYQKYRTRYAHDALEICLDETPIGCWVELEGPGEAIDRAAAALGFLPEDYVLETYFELHDRDARARGQERGDLVFAPGGLRS